MRSSPPRQGEAREHVDVRPLTRADHDQWLALFASYNAFYGREGATALAPRIVSCTWERLLDPDEAMHGLVADAGGRLVGIAHYLFDLFIAPHARGRGIARRLVLQVSRDASLAQASEVYWQTHETNTAAISLYEKLARRSGFLVYERPAGW